MEVFRICRAEYAGSLVSSGSLNRWNLDHEYVIYAASSRSLATLELIVHSAHINPSADFRVMVISLPDDSGVITSIGESSLPAGWRKMSAYP
ncbi:MAG TPA: RES domain-containing protein, partial [Bacteroidales bacterium]|nr:RES domain-containing protein [Bacteroidales bacterium]